MKDGVCSDIRQSRKSMGVWRRMGVYSVLLKLLHSDNLIWGIELEKQINQSDATLLCDVVDNMQLYYMTYIFIV